jgi:small-conductance mechanosensitive channel/uncharacterized small protein (DUF1192 family)
MDFSALLRDVPVSVGVVLVLVLGLRLTDRIMERQTGVTQFTRQLTIALLAALSAFVALVALPNSIVSDSDVVRLAGVMAGVLVTLASTTLVANAFAGLMMRNVRSFELGDFIEIEEHIGRVSQRGLFHIEIQTALSDLVTLPNQFLVTRPLRVIRSSGTVITADVSLGYDAAHQIVEPLLIRAAERAHLAKPFVQVITLGDYTVTYRISGLLEDVKTLFTAQSSLRRRVLDALHEGGIEIASPLLLGHRALPQGDPLIPHPDAADTQDEEEESSAPADIIFSKAEEAVADARAATELDQMKGEARTLEGELKKAERHEREELQERLSALNVEIARLEAEIEAHDVDDEIDGEEG